MSGAAVPLRGSPDGPIGEKAAVGLIDAWVKSVDQFRQWQRKEIFEKQPSPEQLAEHRRTLTWLLRATRLLQTLVLDPEFPARQFAPTIAGRLLQLEESWEVVHNPMSPSEADNILKAAFPDAPGTGSPG